MRGCMQTALLCDVESAHGMSRFRVKRVSSQTRYSVDGSYL